MAFTLSLGARAPDFTLPGVDGKDWSLADFATSRVLVLVFSCNHCPYVVGSEERMIAFAKDYAEQGVSFVAINSNAESTYADDSLAHMVERVRERGFNFPYLHDATQEAALSYGALRTPHYFVFGSTRELQYTGRMDDSPRNAAQATTRELRDAVDSILLGQDVEQPLTNPLGCNVKWAGKEKHWMPAEACDLVPPAK